VFSPYYALARRRGQGDPENHVALNVALYGSRGKRWTLTERGRGALQRDHDHLVIGPSQLAWDGSCLTVDIKEIASPIPSRVRGVVRLRPAAIVDQSFALDAAGLHHWRPIAPVSRVEVAFDQPRLEWSGSGYFDWNSGAVPLEKSFERWDWSRASTDRGTTILYDVTERDGRDAGLAIHVDAMGQVKPIMAPPRVTLPASRVWRIGRGTRHDIDAEVPARVVKTLEDTPFYVRSLVSSRIKGTEVTAMHESLSLDRFRSPVVQLMLPFRMPRRIF
jgi:carotenoid 1,2-hydratase